MRLIAPGPSASAVHAPPWVEAAIAAAPERRELRDGLIALDEEAAIVRVSRSGVSAADAAGMRAIAAELYDEAFAALDEADAPNVARAWNFVPDLLRPMASGGDRYMAFNAGRHEAMRRRYADDLSIAPAGTAVGHSGDSLSIVLLATRGPVSPVENPLQIPAYRYSTRFGLLPPCFSRATRCIWGGRPMLFVSGTAAIRGEASCFAGDAERQLALTLDNLRELLEGAGIADDGNVLDSFESLRAYVPRSAHLAFFRAQLDRPHVELVPVAALCRQELLVEIEGVAAVS